MLQVIEYIPKGPFFIKCHFKSNGSGYWESTIIEIFNSGKTKIGEYERNYGNYGLETFSPFCLNGTWYALYSKNYTGTRVAKLEPLFEDWCGEEPCENGFCPTELLVPQWGKSLLTNNDGSLFLSKDNSNIWYGDISDKLDNKWAETGYCNFGLVSGCVWGDDTSWKVQFLDLRQIQNKILIRTDAFGYIPLAHNSTLKDINISCEFNDGNKEIDYYTFTIPTVKYFNANKEFKINLLED